jgi:hypothetical protein
MYEKQLHQKATSSKVKPLYIKLSTGLADMHLGALVDSVCLKFVLQSQTFAFVTAVANEIT